MKRKIYFILMLLMLNSCFVVCSVYADDIIRVYVNETEVGFDVVPQLIENRTMVPVRGIFEALDAQVMWNGESQTVTAVRDDKIVTLVIGEPAIYVNGNRKELDAVSFLQNDRTFVPLRAIGEAFDCRVEWQGEEGQVMITTQTETKKAINHRGYRVEAPENTLAAFRMSKQQGFKYVEADVQKTADGIAVLIHDSTIDRTSNGKGQLSEMTYAEVSRYDFGSWKSEKYAGEKIPTFEEFIALCKELELHPYIEVAKNNDWADSDAQKFLTIVSCHGMQDDVTWISFKAEPLQQIQRLDKTARLGLICESLTDEILDAAMALRTGKNEVFLDVHHSTLTPDGVLTCMVIDMPLEVWTVNSKEAMGNLDPYVSGVTSDYLNVNTVLTEK